MHIKMQGTPNFRDLGGIVTRTNKQIRTGLLFRSGLLSKLTPADLVCFKGLNIQTIIDFRTPDEIEQDPDLYPEGTQYIKAGIVNPADMKPAFSSVSPSTVTAQQIEAFMIETYIRLIGNLKNFQPVFDALLSNKSLLFHCTAGKDRTGTAAALVLMALDVDKETIINDYMLSNYYNEVFFQENAKKMKVYGFDEEVIRELWSVRPVYLQMFFDIIEKQFKTPERMLEQIFGLNAEKRQLLIKNYTAEILN